MKKKLLTKWVDSSIIVSCRQVSDYIKEEFGVKFSVSGTYKLLLSLGYGFKQLSLFPSKLDVEKQHEWVNEYKTLESSLDDDEVILFLDGVHPQHNTSSSKVWRKKGQRKYIPSNSGSQRINLNGAYNPHNQDVIIREDDSINAQSTILLLAMILTKYKGKKKIYCVADNATYYKSRMVKEFVENNDEIEMMFLPPYSPNLNLIERLWKYIRRKTIHTRYYEKFGDFRNAIFGQIQDLENQKEELKSFIGTNFHLFESSNIAFR